MSAENRDSPIESFFSQALQKSLHSQRIEESPEVERYLVRLLVDFLHEDKIFSIRDSNGHRLKSVTEMLEYGDIRLKAENFKRERDVHRHIGDFILFWTGVFPEFLPTIAAPGGQNGLLDFRLQGQFSYHVASTFDYEPYADEARILKRLSDGFETYQKSLSLIRSSFDGLGRGGFGNDFRV